MSDFGDMLREAMLADEPYRPDASREAIERAVRGFETRARTIRRLGLVMAGGPGLITALGLWVFFSATAGEDHRVLGALLTLFGIGASGLGKLWFHAMSNHLTLLRELKATQLAVAELAERRAAEGAGRE